MDSTKMTQAYLDSPRQEFSNSNDGLGIIVALLVCRGVNFFCVRISDAQSSCTSYLYQRNAY